MKSFVNKQFYAAMFCLFVFSIQSSYAQTQGGEIPAEVKKRFDDRIGTWDIRLELYDVKGNIVRTEHEREVAEYIMNNKVVKITGYSESEIDFTGMMFYNERLKATYYITVDRNGEHVDMKGTPDSYEFTMTEPLTFPDGKKWLFRRRFYDIKQDAMTGEMLRSKDMGKTWITLYKQFFTRVDG